MIQNAAGLVGRRGGNVRGVARTEKRRIEDMLDIAAQTGVPAAQRDPDTLATLKVPAIGTGPRTADKTVRRLTRVERLLRSGVLEPHEAQACEWYADIAALAWDTTGCTANYEGSSGGGGAHAPDRLMAKHQDVAFARDDHREARAMLGTTMADAFEAIVCRNEALGPTAAAAFPDLQRSAAGERMRYTLKFCANKIHERFGRLMGWQDAPFVATKVPPAKPTGAASVKPACLVTAEIDAAILRDCAAGGSPGFLMVAPLVRDAIRKEAGKADVFRGLTLIVRDSWRWGYVLIDAGADPLGIAA